MMTRHLMLTSLLVLAMCLPTLAQQDAPATPKPPAEPILAHLPTDGLGFVMAGNVEDLLKGTEKFLGQIGMGDMVQAMAPGGILPMITMTMGLGEGYNPAGGIAVAMLDPDKAGVDMSAMISGGNPGGDPPIVILVAGKDIPSVFPAAQPGQEEGTMIIPPMGKTYVKQMGSYIALAPSGKALELLAASPRATSLSPAKQKALLSAAGGYYLNFQVLAPIMEKVTQAQQEQMENAQYPDPSMMMFSQTMGMYGKFLDQMDAMIMTFRYTDKGALLDIMVDYLPGSDLAKQIATYQNTTAPMINRVPDLPYVVAGGMVIGDATSLAQQNVAMMENILGMQGLMIPEDLQQRMIKLGEAMGEHVTAMQFVFGAPNDSGLFGLGFVVECDDADAVKKLLPEKAAILTDLVQKTVGKTENDLEGFQVVYKENVATVAGVSVDAMEITATQLSELSENEREEMTLVLGQDVIRFHVAQVDPKTLVVTFGGAESYLAAAIEAAMKGGPISASPAVADAMAPQPKNRIAAMILSPKNGFETIQAGMQKVGESSDLPESFAFQSAVPISMTSTVQGTTVASRFYFPAETIKDIVNYVQAEMMAGQMPDFERDRMQIQAALEMYKSDKGSYPDTLDKLVPEYLPAIPTSAEWDYDAQTGTVSVAGQPQQGDF